MELPDKGEGTPPKVVTVRGVPLPRSERLRRLLATEWNPRVEPGEHRELVSQIKLEAEALIPTLRFSDAINTAVLSQNIQTRFTEELRSCITRFEDVIVRTKANPTPHDLRNHLLQTKEKLISLRGVLNTTIQESLVTEEAIDLLKLPGLQALAAFQRRSEELERLLPELRQHATRSALSDEATHFQKQAGSDGWAVWGYLTIALLVSVVLGKWANDGVASVESTALKLAGQTTTALSQGGPWWFPHVAPRIVVMSAGLAVLYWFLQSARLAHQNRIQNLHRARSLETMRRFLLATTDQRLQDQVMLQATLAAFSPPPGAGGGAGDSTKAIVNLKGLQFSSGESKPATD